MTTAHRNSHLNAGGFVHALQIGDHYFPFDNLDAMSSRGLLPTVGSGLILLEDSGRFGPGVGVHDGYTNLVTNGAFESNNLSYWFVNKSTNAQATMTLLPKAFRGRPSVLCRATAAENWIVYQQSSFQSHVFDTAATYSLGFWHKAYDGGFFQRLASIRSGSGSNVVLDNVAFTPTDVWQYFETSFVPLVAGSSPQFYVSDGQRLNAGFLMSDLMLVKNPYCPPYGVGAQGNTVLTYDISQMLLKDKGSVLFWIRNSKYLRNTPNLKSQNIYPIKLFSGAYGTEYDDIISIQKVNSENKSNFWSTSSTSSTTRTENKVYTTDLATAIAEKDWMCILMQWDKAGLPSGSTKELYLNGALQGGVNTAALPNNLLKTMRVGSWDGSYGRPNTDLSELVVSRRTYNPDEADALWRSQSAYYDPFDYRIIV